MSPPQPTKAVLFLLHTASSPITAPAGFLLPGSLPSVSCMQHAYSITPPIGVKQQTASAFAEGQVVFLHVPAAPSYHRLLKSSTVSSL